MLRLIPIFCICILFGCQSEQSSQVSNDPIGDKSPELEYLQARMWPDKDIDQSAYLKAAKIAKEGFATQRSEGTWVSQGPGNISGRVSTVAIDGDGAIYIGYSKSGVFKSIDDGATFSPIIDDQPFLAVSDIEIDPTDDQTIYVGTGDVDISIMYGIGNGVLKSTNGGASWQNVGLVEESIISRVHVDPSNPNIVYAGAMGLPSKKSDKRGVYKSNDAGGTWEQVLFVNDSTGIQDLLVDPTNPDIAYATGWNRLRSNRSSTVSGPDARIYRTRDGGMTWDTLTQDLPEGDFARIGLAMSGSNPDIIYANYSTTQNFISMHKSLDGGDSWDTLTVAANHPELNGSHGGFAWFFGQMGVNPNNDDDIFLLGLRAYRSLDGGLTWTNVTGNMHVDNHDVTFDGDRIYVANDGGAYRTEDVSSGWTDLDFEVTGMLYKVGYNPHEPDLYYGGAQDNGTYRGNADDINGWIRYAGGDGFYPAFHPEKSDVFFTSSQNGSVIMRDDNGAFEFVTDNMDGRFFWDTPYFLSPQNPDMLIVASDRVYAAFLDTDQVIVTDRLQLSDNLTEPDAEWQSHSISTIDQSPIDGTVLYAGTTDGLIWRTTDFGSSWDQIGQELPRRYVSKIVTSPTEVGRVYMTQTGYRDGDYIPHVYISDDYGDTWTSIDGNLPPFSVNDLVIYADTDDQTLFVATDGGVYFTKDGGLEWDRLGENMPIISAWDLEYNVAKNEMVVGTFGRGILSFGLEQVDIEPIMTSVDDAFGDELEVSIYPTLVNAKLNLKQKDGVELKYNLIDNQGSQIGQGQISPSQPIDCTSLSPGIYYLHLNLDDRSQVERFIKL